jgi:YbgC/YbaW family acyl-CoA thioester hydrolase
MLKEEITVTVTEAELDAEYQHLHHSKYCLLFEQGRTSLMKKAGLPLHAVIAEGLFPVVTQLSVTYLREVTSGQYNISTAVSEIRWKVMVFEQLITDFRGKEIAQATVQCMILKKSAGKAIAVPDGWKAKFDPSQAS